MDLDINGPWIVEHADEAAFYICKADTSNFYGAEIPAVVALLAAAPDMLEALSRVLNGCEHGDGTTEVTPEAMTFIRATIAKATRV